MIHKFLFFKIRSTTLYVNHFLLQFPTTRTNVTVCTQMEIKTNNRWVSVKNGLYYSLLRTLIKREKEILPFVIIKVITALYFFNEICISIHSLFSAIVNHPFSYIFISEDGNYVIVFAFCVRIIARPSDFVYTRGVLSG